MSAAKVIVRTFTSTAAQQQLVKPPVAVFGIGGRYATALYSAASKSNALDAVEKDLVKFHNASKDDIKFKQFIENPVVNKNVKAEALRSVSQKLSLSPSATNLLTLLAENGRLKILDQVTSAYKTIMAAHRGEVQCEVTSAKPLDEAMKKELEGVLKKFTKGNQTILLSSKVDPSIIGGLVVTIGDKYVDMSIASKIKKYTELISASA